MDRLLLSVLCLVVAPIAGFFVGSEVAQTAADASDAPLSLVVGGTTAVALSAVAARSFGRTWTRAARWAVASLAATGVLLLVAVVFLFFILDFQPA